jgi:outer membrane protein assembly factor BamE (lipoprotein component of BamABCDE complex)
MKKIIICGFLVLLTSCAQQPIVVVDNSEKITLGDVQSKIKVGLSSADVIKILSSPNIVSTNKDNTETWVYDKVSLKSEVMSSQNSTSAITSSKTLIVTIKFNKNKEVESVQYRQTSY